MRVSATDHTELSHSPVFLSANEKVFDPSSLLRSSAARRISSGTTLGPALPFAAQVLAQPLRDPRHRSTSLQCGLAISRVARQQGTAHGGTVSSIDSLEPRVPGDIAGKAVHRLLVVRDGLKHGRSPMLPFFGDLPGPSLPD